MFFHSGSSHPVYDTDYSLEWFPHPKFHFWNPCSIFMVSFLACILGWSNRITMDQIWCFEITFVNKSGRIQKLHQLILSRSPLIPRVVVINTFQPSSSKPLCIKIQLYSFHIFHDAFSTSNHIIALSEPTLFLLNQSPYFLIRLKSKPG